MNYINNLFCIPSIHPLFFLTVAIIAGIYYQSYYSLSLTLVISLGCITIISMLLPITKKIPLTLLFFPSFFILGALLYKKQCQNHEYLCHMLAKEQKTITIKIETIEPLIDHNHLKQKIVGHIVSIKNDTLPWSCYFLKKRILGYFPKITTIQPDDTIQLKNVTCKPPTNNSFRTYLIKEGFIASLFMTDHNYTLCHRPTWSLIRSIALIKNTVRTSLQQKLSPKIFALFSMIFLGNKQVKKEYVTEIRHNHVAWGTVHVLARSGLHLVIFIMIWNLLLALIPLSFFIKQLFLIAISSLYLLLSWTTISFMRAFSTFFLYKIFIIMRIPSDCFHLLTLVTFFTLLSNPCQLFFLDFQLSFSFTYALIWLNRTIHQSRSKKSLLAK